MKLPINRLTSILALPLLAALSAPSLARVQVAVERPSQGQVDTELVPSGIASRSFGLAHDGADVIAGGPRYRARFDASGLTFTPAFGADSVFSEELAFRLSDVHLGGQLVHAAVPTLPAIDGGVVVYHRADGIDERYEVRRAGVAQSFVFADLPAVQGDLVVRGQLATGLDVRTRATGGLLLERAGIGSLEIGGVTGIDANGRSFPGSIAYDGEWLELRLPSEDVADAVFPLVLDPLIGNVVTVAGSFDDGAPDVAYDATSDMYLVVYERRFSASDVDLRGQRIDGSGQLVGGSIFIESNATLTALAPTVANSNATDSFFVAWQEGTSFLGPWDVRGRSVAAATGIQQSAITIAGLTTLDETAPDAGGEATTNDDDVLVVWHEDGVGARGAQVTVPTASTPFVFSTFSIATGSDIGPPVISKSGGAQGRLLVVYPRFFSTPAPGDNDLYGIVFDRNGNAITSATSLPSDIGPDERAPDVDGDGSDFWIVFERTPSLESPDADVLLLKAEYVVGSLAVPGPATVVQGVVGDAAIDPVVADLGEKVFVAWSDEFFFLDYDLLVQGLDPSNCKTCGVQTAAALGPGRFGRPALVSARSGDPNAPAEGLLVWEAAELTPPFESDVLAQRLVALGDGGPVTNQGGGCGGAGVISTSGPFAAGNPAFEVRLDGADPGAGLAFLAFSSAENLLPCGPCEWLIWSPNLVFSAPVTGGSGSSTIPVPCQLAGAVGVPLYCQWTVVGTATTPCNLFPNVGFTDRLRLEIGL